MDVVVDATLPKLHALPDDVLRAVFGALLGAPCARTGGVLVGDVPKAEGALSLAASHPRFAHALQQCLKHVSVAVGGGSAEREAAALLRLAIVRRLSLTGRHGLPRLLLDALPTRGVRAIDIDGLPGVPDAGWARLLTAHAETLRVLSVQGAHGFGVQACSAAARSSLHTVRLKQCSGVTREVLDELLSAQGDTVVVLEIVLRFDVASLVGARCAVLQELVLGPSDTDATAVVQACVANAGTLVKARIGTLTFRETHCKSLVRDCAALVDVAAPALAAVFVATTLRHRATAVALRATTLSTDVRKVAQWCPNLAEIDWEGDGESPTDAMLDSVIALIAKRGPRLSALRLAAIRIDDDALERIGVAARSLSRVRLDALDLVSAAGVEALVKVNGKSLTDVAIGAKCKRLSNVSLMCVLGKHCKRLRVVSFPRWGAVRRVPAEERLLAAVHDFHRRAPFATIVAE